MLCCVKRTHITSVYTRDLYNRRMCVCVCLWPVSRECKLSANRTFIAILPREVFHQF